VTLINIHCSPDHGKHLHKLFVHAQLVHWCILGDNAEEPVFHNYVNHQVIDAAQFLDVFWQQDFWGYMVAQDVCIKTGNYGAHPTCKGYATHFWPPHARWWRLSQLQLQWWSDGWGRVSMSVEKLNFCYLLSEFLGASKRLYNSLGLLVGLSVPTMKFLNLLASKSGNVEIALPSRLVWIILIFLFCPSLSYFH
jgi:hypothetical protein